VAGWTCRSFTSVRRGRKLEVPRNGKTEFAEFVGTTTRLDGEPNWVCRLQSGEEFSKKRQLLRFNGGKLRGKFMYQRVRNSLECIPPYVFSHMTCTRPRGRFGWVKKTCRGLSA
jgi:hypothetical protein